ncbi:unnamed protein product [Clavelina lepadiformis]|uniref:receptor protein-tyrosine kinase n=1 Tax=Clavelina lepadiformis TaxID=159417 RepID=A0ABP0GJ65_CLALP
MICKISHGVCKQAAANHKQANFSVISKGCNESHCVELHSDYFRNLPVSRNQGMCCHETFPCSRNRIVERGGSYYDCYCPVDEIGNTDCTICEPFSGQCQILSKDRRNVFFPAHFGRVYEFYIRALSGDCMDPSRTFQNVNSIFCVQQLVEMVGIPLDDAIPFCEKEQTLPESYMSGPVTNLTVCNVTDNIVENSLNVEVCWEDPLDLKPTTSISFYYLQWLHPGKKRPLGYKQVNSHFSNNDGKDSFHYKQSITKLIYNEMYLFRVTPVYEEGWDYEEGVVRETTYASEDLDGCASKYCDSRARCVDFSPGSSTPAKCSCPYNFTGNGISTSIEGGTGCIGPCQTQASLHCHSKAECIDNEHSITGLDCQCLKRSQIQSAYIPDQNHNISPLRLVGQFSSPSEEPIFGKKWEINLDDLRIEGVIGRGNFGVVRKALLTQRNKSEVLVAVKSLAGNVVSNRREDFLAEMALLISLGSHENVLSVIGACTCRSSIKEESPLLITQYMMYGDLLHFLWDSRELSNRKADPVYNFTEASLFTISRQVASGLHFLSQSRVIHGDVAARNVLVGENLLVKISDFGLANDVYRYGFIKGATERRVPFKWISPERMSGGKSPITWRSDV